MRRHLMLSTAAIGLMLASGVAYAQAPGERRTSRDGPRSRQRAQRRSAAEPKTVFKSVRKGPGAIAGRGREDKGGAAKQEASDDKRQPAGSAERNQPKSGIRHKNPASPPAIATVKRRARSRDAIARAAPRRSRTSLRRRNQRPSPRSPSRARLASRTSGLALRPTRTSATRPSRRAMRPSNSRRRNRTTGRPPRLDTNRHCSQPTMRQTALALPSRRPIKPIRPTQTNTQVNQQTR